LGLLLPARALDFEACFDESVSERKKNEGNLLCVNIVSMRWLGVILGISLATSSAMACYNDIDTNLTELRDNLDVTKAIIGRFTIYPREYYRRRIEIQSAILKKDPNNLEAYDNISVAYDRVGDGDSALKWIREKRKHLANAPKNQLYSTEANEGTFLIVRWIRGHKPGDLTDAIESEKHIAKALEINPNAHFGREFAQLYSIQAMIECGKNEHWETSFADTLIKIADKNRIDHKKLRFGIAGMMVLGAAWNMPAMIQAIANLVPEEKQVVNLCKFRIGLVIPEWDQNDYPIVEVKKVNSKERTVLHQLVSNGDQFQARREEWVLSQIAKGKHPDTHPDFWKGFVDVPEISEEELIVKRSKTYWEKPENIQQAAFLGVAGGAISIAIGYYIFDRRRAKKRGF
jgi:tetratricopeptide (TPR) repeat protein